MHAGLVCRVGGEEVVVGTAAWMREVGVKPAPETDQRAAKVSRS